MTITHRSFFRAGSRGVPITAKLGVTIICINAITAIFAPVIAPFGESDIVGVAYAPPSMEFLFGTDSLGRDVLSRIIYGARNTIGIALITTLLAFFLGTSSGLLAVVGGKWIDQLFSRIVDVMISMPKLVFALMVLTIFGTSTATLIVTVAVLDSPRIFRISRSLGMNIAVLDFVEVARVRGESMGWIMRKEILPNIAVPLLAEFGLRFTFVFLFISSLGFLGLGIQPPAADWGGMVKENASLISFGNFVVLFPATAIAILALGVNFVVDWIIDLRTVQEWSSE